MYITPLQWLTFFLSFFLSFFFFLPSSLEESLEESEAESWENGRRMTDADQYHVSSFIG